MSLYLYLSIAHANQIFIDILGFIGTFAIWEGTNFIIYDRTDLNVQRLKAARNVNLEIDFLE